MSNTFWSNPGSSTCASMGGSPARTARHSSERVKFTAARPRQPPPIRSRRADSIFSLKGRNSETKEKQQRKEIVMASKSKSIFQPDGKNSIHDGIEHAPGGGKALIDSTDTVLLLLDHQS